MITWGISANSHDAGLAVFENKKLVFASQSERFSRIKNDSDLDKNLISYAKQWGDPNQVVWYENPIKKTLRQLRAGQGLRLKENNIKSYLSSYDINCKIKYVDHHASHAYGGWHTSKLDDTCIICIDAIGEFETFTIWDSTKKKLKKIYSQSYPHSIGLWYSAMTQRIGLKPNEDEYILMGMSAYGDPTRLFEDIINSFIHTHRMGVTPKVTIKKNLHRGCKEWRPDLKSEQDMFDIAAGTQAVYEYLLRYISTWAKQNSKHNNLIFMGGCALNCVANNILTRDWNNIWIMPNPGDSGSAIGCVLAHLNTRIKWDDTFLGYDIKGDYPIDKIIQELKHTGICGVANGKAEFGPRALGNRSLLADPRRLHIKDTVNKIKQRQKFRPFAPAILDEFFERHFEGPKSEYMQFTARCRNPDVYPAITHADNTSRVQSVRKNFNSGFRKLLEAWHKETGCPMLLNTSLNIKGEPIVNTELDAKLFEEKYNIKVFT